MNVCMQGFDDLSISEGKTEQPVFAFGGEEMVHLPRFEGTFALLGETSSCDDK